MTVARDAVLEFATFTTTSPATLSFTPVGTPRGVTVHICINAASTDQITAVTYGGVAMQRVITHADFATEDGRVYTYFLGSGIPTGTQPVSIAHTGTVQTKWAVVQSVTAAGDTEIGTVGLRPQIGSGTEADPTVLLDSGALSALRVGILFSGHDDVSSLTPLAGMEAVGAGNSHDFGTTVVALAEQTTASTGNFNLGFTATVEDGALVVVSIQEIVTDGFPQTVGPTVHAVTTANPPALMPPVVDAGDLLILLFGSTSATVTTPTDWDLLATAVATFELNIFWKIADGSEGGTSVTITTAVKGETQVYRIPAGSWDGVTPPEVGTFASGTSVNPNPPTLTPSWGAEDTLWLAVGVVSSTAATQAVTDYPTNYENGSFIGTAGTASSSLFSARRKLNAASDDPAALTIVDSANWVTQTIAIRPAAASVPAAPTGLAAVATSPTQIDLTWTDNAGDETGFRVERSPDGVGSWTEVSAPPPFNPGPDTDNFSNSGLTCETEYFYRVFAVNAVGDSLPSNTDSATTDTCPPYMGGGNRIGGSGAIRKPPRTGR